MLFISAISEFFQSLAEKNLVPAVVALILVLVAVIAFFLVRMILRKRGAQPEAPQAPAAEAMAPQPAAPPAMMPPAAKDATVSSSVSRSFQQALDLLKANIPESGYRYQVPWFMMMGEVRSGKTTVLANTGLNAPLHIDEEGLSPNELQWKFFDKAVFLDLPGSSVLRTDGKRSDEDKWRQVLKHLVKHRPERPLDGIVLTLPAEDYVGANDNMDDRLTLAADKADILYKKLWDVQKVLGMRLPIYILVTKCDTIRGFKSFASEMPARLHTDIFGWSNPNTLDAAFVGEWVDEAFRTIQHDLFQTQTEVIADGIQVQDADSFFLFPNQFQTIREPLKTTLLRLFRKSAYHDSFFLRGIYFCGQSLGTQQTSLPNSEHIPALASPEDGDIELPEETYAPAPINNNTEAQPIFLRGLFEKKIFPEFGLARPNGKTLIARNRTLRFIQAAIVSIVLLFGFGIYNAHENLLDARKTMIPVLETIGKDLRESRAESNPEQSQGIGLYQLLKNEEMKERFTNRSLNLLEGMTKISSRDMQSIFLPASWFDHIHTDIREAIANAYTHVILKALYIGLKQKAEELYKSEPKAVFAPDEGFDINQLPEMQRLKTFLADMQKLERSVNSYNNLKERADLEELGHIIEFLFEIELPSEFYVSSEYYKDALKQADLKQFHLERLRTLYVLKLQRMIDRLHARVFSRNPLLVDAQDIVSQINIVSTRISADGNDLRAFEDLYGLILQLEQRIKSPEFEWIAKENLHLGTEYDDMVEDLAEYQLFGKDIKTKIASLGTNRFEALKQDLQTVQSDLTGPLIQFYDPEAEVSGALSGIKLSSVFKTARKVKRVVKNPKKQGVRTLEQEIKAKERQDAKNAKLEANQTPTTLNVLPDPIQLTDSVEGLKQALESFLNQDFIIREADKDLVTELYPGTHLRWQVSLLNDAVALSEPYTAFLNSGLTRFPEEMQGRIQTVALQRLEANIIDLVARSQIFEPVQEMSEQLVDAVIRKEVKNFQDATAPLNQLISIGEKLGISRIQQDISPLVIQQAVQLLVAVDLLKDKENLYDFESTSIALWDGQSPLSSVLFGVRSASELTTYLEIQRSQLQRIAIELAKPLVDFLDTKRAGQNLVDLKLLDYWKQIISEIKKSEEQSPGNSVAVLNSFILTEMDTIRLDNCFEKITPSSNKSHDFFMQRRNAFAQLIYNQCQEMARRMIISRFEAANAFFENNTYRSDVVDITDEILPIEEMQTFVELRDFMEELTELDRYSSFYESLEGAHALQDLANVNPALFRSKANIQVKRLNRRLNRRLFEFNPLAMAIQDLNDSLRELNLKSRTGQGGMSAFQNVLSRIDAMEEVLQHPENEWVNQEDLNLGESYQALLQKVQDSRFLGKKARDDMADQAGQEFAALHAKLNNEQTLVTGPVLSKTGDDSPYTLSPGTESLKSSLEDFLNQKFMVESTLRPFETRIRAGTHLVWDSTLLQESVGLAAAYDKFINQEFKRFPVEVQKSIRQLALQRLHINMVNLIRRAQIFETVPESFARLRIEDNVSREVENFTSSAPALGQILNIFSRYSLNSDYMRLHRLVVPQAYDMLQAVDQLFEGEHLYAVDESTINQWNGDATVAEAVFNSKDVDSLKNYLEVQRNRLKVLSQQYAQPLVNFLVTRKNTQDLINLNLLTKWQDITSELTEYDNKTPSSSLLALERFFTEKLVDTNIDNCFIRIQLDESNDSQFFIQRLNGLKQDILNRCRLLATTVGAKRYNALQSTFNQQLAGRFPFANPTLGKIDNEAAPAVLKEFFTSFPEFNTTKALIDRADGFDASRATVVQYLNKMQKARDFFQFYLDEAQADELPVLDFEVSFRVNQRMESRASQIILWQLNAGGQVISSDGATFKGRWVFGNPLTLTLRWAKDSPYLPSPSTNEYGVRMVGGLNLIYDMDNQWSILALISKHQSLPTDFARFNDPQPHTLKFEVETRQASSADDTLEPIPVKAFMRLRVYSPNKNELLVVPEFPAGAPDLRIKQEFSQFAP